MRLFGSTGLGVGDVRRTHADGRSVSVDLEHAVRYGAQRRLRVQPLAVHALPSELTTVRIDDAELHGSSTRFPPTGQGQALTGFGGIEPTNAVVIIEVNQRS